MNFLLSDIAIYALCLLILGLILFSSCYLIKIVRSNAYHEKKIKKAEELYRKKTSSQKGKVKNISKDYIEKSNLLSPVNQKSAS